MGLDLDREPSDSRAAERIGALEIICPCCGNSLWDSEELLRAIQVEILSWDARFDPVQTIAESVLMEMRELLKGRLVSMRRGD